MEFFQLDQNFPIALYNVTRFLDYLVKLTLTGSEYQMETIFSISS